jgi:subtilase family serine protease
VADNQLLIEADGTAANVQAAFNTPLVQYSVNGTTVYVNATDAQVPASLSGVSGAVLGLNNVVAVHFDARTLALNTSPGTDPCTPPNCPTPAIANEVYGPQQYQIGYDAACPSDNPHCPAQNFTPASATAVGIIVEGNLTQVIKDLRTYEQTYKLPQRGRSQSEYEWRRGVGPRFSSLHRNCPTGITAIFLRGHLSY